MKAEGQSAVKRRIRAARVLADLTIIELAERIDTPGLGPRTVRKLEDENERAPRRHELQLIAEACGLPYEFFTVDFAELAGMGSDDDLRQEVADLTEEVRTLQRGIAEAVAAHVEEFVLRRAGELPGAPDEEPRPGRREGS